VCAAQWRPCDVSKEDSGGRHPARPVTVGFIPLSCVLCQIPRFVGPKNERADLLSDRRTPIYSGSGVVYRPQLRSASSKASPSLSRPGSQQRDRPPGRRAPKAPICDNKLKSRRPRPCLRNERRASPFLVPCKKNCALLVLGSAGWLRGSASVSEKALPAICLKRPERTLSHSGLDLVASKPHFDEIAWHQSGVLTCANDQAGLRPSIH
jgi:hypothetical protein